MHVEIVGDSQGASGSRKFYEPVSVITLVRETTNVQRVVESAIGIEEINISRTIGCQSRPGHPDGAFTPVRRQGGLAQVLADALIVVVMRQHTCSAGWWRDHSQRHDCAGLAPYRVAHFHQYLRVVVS